MPSSGKRTLSGWVMVISCPSTSGIVGLSCNSLPRLRGRVGVGVFNPSTLQYGGDEVRLGEGPYEGRLAIDHRARNAPHPELVLHARALVRCNSDGPDLRR